MTSIYNFGYMPSQRSLFPTGNHNIFDFKTRKYIPHQKNYTMNLFFNDTLATKITSYPFTIKSTPNQVFNSIQNKIYKIATSGFYINDLEKIKDFDFENEVIYNDMNTAQLAASCNNYEVLHYLIKNNLIDVNYHTGKYDKTPLHLAVEYDNDLTIKYLLANGANPNEIDSFGFDSFDKAMFRGNKKFDSTVKSMKKYT